MTATLEQLFTQHDLELLGYADTAFVFARPEQPEQVVKVGVDVNDGWPQWAAWCATHRSPHVPVIQACHWIYDGAGRPQLFVGLMERLRQNHSRAAVDQAGRRTAQQRLKRDPLRAGRPHGGRAPDRGRHAARGRAGLPERLAGT